MFENNRPWETFRESLRARGVTLHLLWQANRGVRERDDIAMYAVRADGSQVEKPGMGTLIAIDYGARDGFGLWCESQHGTIAADVDAIAPLRASAAA